jgi:hypothetical protein
MLLSVLLCVYPGLGLLDHITLFKNFQDSPCCFHKQLYILHFYQQSRKVSIILLLTHTCYFCFFLFLIMAIITDEVVSHCSFPSNFLMIVDVERLFLGLLTLLFVSTGVWTQGPTLARQASTTWATPPVLFCVVHFQDRVLRIVCPVWVWATILLASASWVARIIGMSH